MASDFLPREIIAGLPHRPGVYLMRGADSRILYVGKARDLKKRVASYFGRKSLDGKTQALLRLVTGIEVTLTGTEQEALLLEFNLIKAHRPRFNVVLRDDKSYPYVHVTTEQAYPRFEFHRGSRNQPGRYLGPFPNAGAVRFTLQQLQKLFRVRQCTDNFFSNRSRPCLQYQIRRCSAPCVGAIGAEEYQRDVENAIAFINGRGADVLEDLVRRMEQSSAEQEYEQAARYRDQIADIRRVQEQQVIAGGPETDLDAVAAVEVQGAYCIAVLMIRSGRVLGSRAFFPRTESGTGPGEVLSAFVCQHYLGAETPAEILVAHGIEDADLTSELLSQRSGRTVTVRSGVRGKRMRWLELAMENAQQGASQRAVAGATAREQVEQLAKALLLDSVPERIECFDVSHTQGGQPVASCIAFVCGAPLKSDYRRFNIDEAAAGDDYAAIAEAVTRRYRRRRDDESPMPDLVLVDGGRGQLSRVVRELQEMGLTGIPVRSIAKGAGRRSGFEKVFQPDDNRPLSVAPDSGAFRLLQQVRDEAHRFAITGHRGRRGRGQSRSALESVGGLGPKRRKALLQRFGGLQGVARAGVADIALTTGISRALAERIYQHLHDTAADGSGSS